MNTRDIFESMDYGPAPGSRAKASTRARPVTLAACANSTVSIAAYLLIGGPAQ